MTKSRHIPMRDALGDSLHQAQASPTIKAPDRSWWCDVDREQFTAEIAKQVPRWQGRGDVRKIPSDIGLHRAPTGKAR